MRIAVLGGGGWGTTLALILESKGCEVRLWVYEAEEAERMARTRENTTFLPGVPIPQGIAVTHDRMETVRNADLIVLATPSRALQLLQRGKRFATVMLGFAAFNGALILTQILWSGWQSRQLDTPRPLHHHVEHRHLPHLPVRVVASWNPP